jgi:hypothetical protein
MLKGHRILTNDLWEVRVSLTDEIKDFQQHKKWKIIFTWSHILSCRVTESSASGRPPTLVTVGSAALRRRTDDAAVMASPATARWRSNHPATSIHRCHTCYKSYQKSLGNIIRKSFHG